MLVLLFLISSGWVKIKLKLPHFYVSDTCRVPIQPDAPVATAARAKANGRVSMSTRPDPEISGTVEIVTRRRPRLRVVWDLREPSLLSEVQGGGAKEACATGILCTFFWLKQNLTGVARHPLLR